MLDINALASKWLNENDITDVTKHESLFKTLALAYISGVNNAVEICSTMPSLTESQKNTMLKLKQETECL